MIDKDQHRAQFPFPDSSERINRYRCQVIKIVSGLQGVVVIMRFANFGNGKSQLVVGYAQMGPVPFNELLGFFPMVPVRYRPSYVVQQDAAQYDVRFQIGKQPVLFSRAAFISKHELVEVYFEVAYMRVGIKRILLGADRRQPLLPGDIPASLKRLI
ncbi:MAG: hypothetical protein JXA71_19230 [Chitinispirillaceae bacterium]|nr:hypothetical protein [Chitinispirillaceae bacterium]